MTQGTGIDDNVQNLEEFNALLAQTSTQLEEATDSLRGRETDLDELDDLVQERQTALLDRLDEVSTGLEASTNEAKEAVVAVGELAQTSVDSSLTVVEETIETHGGLVEASLDTAGDTLDQASAHLRERGFDQAQDDISRLGNDVAEAETLLEADLDTLDSELSLGTTELGAAVGDVSEAASSFVAEAQSLQDQLGLEALVSFVSEDFVPQVESVAAALASALEEAYGKLRAEIDGIQDQREGDITAALQEQAQYLAEVAASQLGEALDTATEGGLDPWLSQLDGADATLSAGAEVADAAARLIPELVVTTARVAEIDQLIDSLNSE